MGTGTGTGSGGPKVDVNDLKLKILSDAQFVDRMKADPDKALAEVGTRRALETDVWVYRMVVISLGLTILTTAIGFILISLIGTGVEPPAGLVALGSAAVGALAGLLAPSPGGGGS